MSEKLKASDFDLTKERLDAIQECYDKLERTGFGYSGLMFYPMAAALMDSARNALCMVMMIPTNAFWQRTFNEFKEEFIAKIEKELDPKPGDRVYEAIQRVTPWPDVVDDET